MEAHSARRAPLVLIIASVLLGWLVLASDPGAYGWPHPELRAEPPYRLFVLVVGVGLLALTVATVARSHTPRLREFGALALVAILATWLSAYRQAGAQPCCETGWIFGFGYPFEYRFGGVAPSARISREAAEALMGQSGESDQTDPIALIGNLLFWGYAALLAYLPIRVIVRHLSVPHVISVPLDADSRG